VESLDQYCFDYCRSLSTVLFESGSKLLRLEHNAFCSCSSLSSICVPSSVRDLCRGCFSRCPSLSTVSFESESRLSCLDTDAFADCPSLLSICLPPQLASLNWTGSAIRTFSVAAGNCHFTVEGPFLMNFTKTLICRYVGADTEVTIPKTVTRLGHHCFAGCETISSVLFEFESQLCCIEESAFSDCPALLSICIPSSVKVLCRYCFYARRSLSAVTFEPGSNLARI
jgi:hypothetical protein